MDVILPSHPFIIWVLLLESGWSSETDNIPKVDDLLSQHGHGIDLLRRFYMESFHTVAEN